MDDVPYQPAAPAKAIVDDAGLQTALHPHWGMADRRPASDVGAAARSVSMSGCASTRATSTWPGPTRSTVARDGARSGAARPPQGPRPGQGRAGSERRGPLPRVGHRRPVRAPRAGGVDIAGVIAALEADGYRGWYVIEQDVSLKGDPPTGKGPKAARSRQRRPPCAAWPESACDPAGLARPRTRGRAVTNTIGIGVVGFGWMGQVHARAYLNLPFHVPHGRAAPIGGRLRHRSPAGAGAGRLRVRAGHRLACGSSARDDIEVVDHHRAQPAAPGGGRGRGGGRQAPVLREASGEGSGGHGGHRAGRAHGRHPHRDAATTTGGRPSSAHPQLIADGRLGALTHYRGRFFSMYGRDRLGVLSWRFLFDEAGYGVLSDLMSPRGGHGPGHWRSDLAGGLGHSETFIAGAAASPAGRGATTTAGRRATPPAG